MIIEELSVVLSVIATKYHGCLPGGIQLRGATAAITGVLILGKLACLGFPRSTFLSNRLTPSQKTHHSHTGFEKQGT